ncbi:hypothetical protein GCM10009535_38180 [Streptomyces thermocarboxydovorans]|uniref:Uncharacterized protein n=1 Tax=Streptomyces thermocarboxydovorans TaxID=59298 RepID=A0ABP3SNR5_9ACTN
MASPSGRTASHLHITGPRSDVLLPSTSHACRQAASVPVSDLDRHSAQMMKPEKAIITTDHTG